MIKVYIDSKNNQSKPWRKIHQELLNSKPDLCLRNYQGHKPLGHKRMYQRSAGVCLPCSYAAASYTPAVGHCQVMELEWSSENLSVFLLLAGSWHQSVCYRPWCGPSGQFGAGKQRTVGRRTSERSRCQLQPAWGAKAGRAPDGFLGLRLHSHRKC